MTDKNYSSESVRDKGVRIATLQECCIIPLEQQQLYLISCSNRFIRRQFPAGAPHP